jgi:hypothetical protein
MRLKQLKKYPITILTVVMIAFFGIYTALTIVNTLKDQLTITIPKEPPAPQARQLTPEAKKWLLAVGALLSKRNNEDFSELKSNKSEDELKLWAWQSWGVTNREQALSTLDWLKDFGHRKQFEKTRRFLVTTTNNDEETYKKLKPDLANYLYVDSPADKKFLLDFVWSHKDDLGQKSLLSWDYIRLVNMARWSYSLHFISEAEAWDYIYLAGKKLQDTYSSWDELGDQYFIGRVFWKYSFNNQDLEPTLIWLKTNAISPWKTIPWNQKLD